MSREVDDVVVQELERTIGQFMRRAAMPPCVERDDLAQEAALALLLRPVDPARSDAERAVYTRQVAHGAMVDALRKNRAGYSRRTFTAPMHVHIDAAPDKATADGSPPSAATIRACRRVLSEPHPLPLIFTCMLAGVDGNVIAAHLGVSASRVVQHVAKIRDILSTHLECHSLP